MHILAAAFRTLAEDRPSTAFKALEAAVAVSVESRRSEPLDEDFHGDGLADYAPRMTIAPIPGVSDVVLLPTSIVVHQTDFYAAPLVIAHYDHGLRMIAIPDEDFGVMERPHGDGHVYGVARINQ